jgi:hypothetical protein
MATADTAKLIAALELQDKFTKPLGGAERALGGFDKKMSSIEASGRRMGAGLGAAARNVTLLAGGAAVAGIGLLAVNVKKGVDALNELENVTVATNTVLDSTKAVSGQTADSIRDMSEGFEDLNATMDDKVIQSGANMLLTFTNVREKAFEPALEAALNMNEAMGGGPEGLQSTIIQVGKALNDPIKGVTALRRVGVQLSSQQEDQIKTLIEQNDLYGAQQIILDELTTQFGGRFAAAGKTAEGSQAALADRLEDVQMALAGPLIPAIDRVRDKLIDFLGTDRVLGGAEKLGEAIAGLFTDSNIERGVGMVEGLIDKLTTGDFSGITAGIGGVAEQVAGLPWESIADAARLLGTGSKALLDAFLGLPSWVQTAVLTGWGLNKLTGGALGGIVGELGKGLIKGVLGINAGVVHVNGKVVTGPGGGPAGPGGGGGLLGTLKGLGALASIPLAGAAATMSVDFVGTASTQRRGVLDKLEAQPRRTADEIDDSIENVEGALRAATDGPLATMVSNTTGLTDRLEAELAELKELRYGTDSIDRNMLVTADRIMQQKAAIDQAKAAASSDAAMIIGATGALGPRIDRVANTPHNVTANVDTFVNVNANIGVSVLGQQAYRTRTIYNRSSESTNTAGY